MSTTEQGTVSAVVDRVLARCVRGGRVLNGKRCLLWQGATSKDGYGTIHVGSRVLYVHRIVNEHCHGPIPSGIFVCHRCDTPRCVEDAHHFRGTSADNSADMVAKGRQSRRPSFRGEAAPNARLTENDVREIRRRQTDGETFNALAMEFAVSKGLVSHIVARRKWDHVQ